MPVSTSSPAFIATLVVIAVLTAFFVGFIGFLIWKAIRPGKPEADDAKRPADRP